MYCTMKQIHSFQSISNDKHILSISQFKIHLLSLKYYRLDPKVEREQYLELL
jgi:hypothetical protein